MSLNSSIKCQFNTRKIFHFFYAIYENSLSFLERKNALKREQKLLRKKNVECERALLLVSDGNKNREMSDVMCMRTFNEYHHLNHFHIHNENNSRGAARVRQNFEFEILNSAQK